MESSSDFNPPRWHVLPVLWTLLCAGGVALGGGIMVAYPFPGSGWQGGAFLVLMCAVAYLGTAAWWLTGQHVIKIRGNRLTIQSWLDVLRHVQGVTIAIHDLTEAALIFDSGKKLQLAGPRFRWSAWAGVWPRQDLDSLIATLGQLGVSTRREW